MTMKIGSIYQLKTQIPLWKRGFEPTSANECIRWLLENETFFFVSTHKTRDYLFLQVWVKDNLGWIILRSYDATFDHFEKFVQEITAPL